MLSNIEMVVSIKLSWSLWPTLYIILV